MSTSSFKASSPASALPHLDQLVVVDVVQGVGAIPSSDHRGVRQEVGPMDAILKIKLEAHDWSKESFNQANLDP